MEAAGSQIKFVSKRRDNPAFHCYDDNSRRSLIFIDRYFTGITS